jgi:putative PIG3 family NAD(P)H quinone oxidoreductase
MANPDLALDIDTPELAPAGAAYRRGMRAITIPTPGDADALVIADVPTPETAADNVLVQVAAAGVNRAELLQRQGVYPPPPGSSAYPGLEVSGTISVLGSEVTGWAVGDQVCALLSGGGYAEQVAVPATQLLPVPHGVSLVDAAALPEVVSTVWSNVFMTANLQPGQTILIHGGSSGIGTMAIQLAGAIGARIAVTAGTGDKLEACHRLGAEILINYREQDFVQVLDDATNGLGADVILDNIGAKYLARNVSALAVNGRLVIIGLQGGVKAELDISTLLRKCAAVIATSLRGRPEDERAVIVAAVREHVWPLIESGHVKPVVHRTFPLAQAADAHRELEAGANTGKVLLTT